MAYQRRAHWGFQMVGAEAVDPAILVPTGDGQWASHAGLARRAPVAHVDRCVPVVAAVNPRFNTPEWHCCIAPSREIGAARSSYELCQTGCRSTPLGCVG